MERAMRPIESGRHLGQGFHVDAAHRLAISDQISLLADALDAGDRELESFDVIACVLQSLAERLDAHSCALWGLRESARELVCEAVHEGNGKSDVPCSSRVDAVCTHLLSAASWSRLCRMADLQIVADIKNSAFAYWTDSLLACGIRTSLVLPMRVRGRVTGIIALHFCTGRLFQPEEIDLARTMAREATLARQFVRMLDRTRSMAVDSERNRMSRDLHDTLGQGLTSVILQLEAATDADSKTLTLERDQHLDRAMQLARQCLHEARRSVRALRPAMMQRCSLHDALKQLVQGMTDGTRLRGDITFAGSDGLSPLSENLQENLYRIVQEALTNTIRHARASCFYVRLHVARQEVLLELRDDGCGFDHYRISDGFGLRSIAERVEQMCGALSIDSLQGSGTMIFVRIPIG